MPADCPCHGLPRAQNGQCIVKRRATQARYERTEKGRAVAERYNGSAKGISRQGRYNGSVKGWARGQRYSLRRQRVSVLERLEELQAEREGLNG